MDFRKIELGRIQIENWSPKNGEMFSYPMYYEEEEYANLVIECYPSEIVLEPNTEYTLVIAYPLSVPYEKKFKVNSDGMTRLKFVDLICKAYRKIYKEEDKSTKIKVGNISGMLNRNATNGKYGIWGHSIEDLLLCDASVGKKNRIIVGVDS